MIHYQHATHALDHSTFLCCASTAKGCQWYITRDGTDAPAQSYLLCCTTTATVQCKVVHAAFSCDGIKGAHAIAESGGVVQNTLDVPQAITLRTSESRVSKHPAFPAGFWAKFCQFVEFKQHICHEAIA